MIYHIIENVHYILREPKELKDENVSLLAKNEDWFVCEVEVQFGSEPAWGGTFPGARHSPCQAPATPATAQWSI